MLLQGLMKLKKRVNSELKYLNEKLDQCKAGHVWRCGTIEKQIKKKITEWKQKEEQKKETTERK